MPECARKEWKLRTSPRHQLTPRTRGIAGLSTGLEGFRSATENRGVPGSRTGLATPVDETRPLSCGVTLASQVRQKVRQKIGQNRSRASERRTSSPGSRDKRPANAHQLPRDEARPTGFEPVTFGSVDRRSNEPAVLAGRHLSISARRRRCALTSVLSGSGVAATRGLGPLFGRTRPSTLSPACQMRPMRPLRPDRPGFWTEWT